jgi:hypothetical protein
MIEEFLGDIILVSKAVVNQEPHGMSTVNLEDPAR